MDDFLRKYYPGIKQKLHEQRIKRITDLLEIEKIKYKNLYKKEFNEVD